MEEFNVKVGDKVAYYSGGLNNTCSICEVSRVTPTGRIRIKNHNYITFDKYGKEMGKSDPWIIRASITKLTPELEKQIIETNTIKSCLKKMRNIQNIDYETAVKILKILE